MARNGVASWLMRSDTVDLRPSDSTEAHVLAVDDSLVDRKVIERLLKISSCKVTAVDSGIRALEFLGLDEQKSPVNFDRLKVDLIITDYCMPGMNGYELLKKIKESAILRQIPVVIMSSEKVMARINRCLEEGAADFIVKPVKLSDVKRLKDFMSRVKAAATATTAAATAGDKEIYNNHKRKLRESFDEQFSSPAATSPTSSLALSPSSESQFMSSPSDSPSVTSSSPPSSAPGSPSSLESPTRRLRMANSH